MCEDFPHRRTVPPGWSLLDLKRHAVEQDACTVAVRRYAGSCACLVQSGESTSERQPAHVAVQAFSTTGVFVFEGLQRAKPLARRLIACSSGHCRVGRWSQIQSTEHQGVRLHVARAVSQEHCAFQSNDANIPLGFASRERAKGMFRIRRSLHCCLKPESRASASLP